MATDLGNDGLQEETFPGTPQPLTPAQSAQVPQQVQRLLDVFVDRGFAIKVPLLLPPQPTPAHPSPPQPTQPTPAHPLPPHTHPSFSACIPPPTSHFPPPTLPLHTHFYSSPGPPHRAAPLHPNAPALSRSVPSSATIVCQTMLLLCCCLFTHPPIQVGTQYIPVMHHSHSSAWQSAVLLWYFHQDLIMTHGNIST